MENIGYKIIMKAEYCRKYEIVLGEKKGGCTPYVTWEHEIGTTNFFWGHYFKKKTHALMDFHERTLLNLRVNEPPFSDEEEKIETEEE